MEFFLKEKTNFTHEEEIFARTVESTFGEITYIHKTFWLVPQAIDGNKWARELHLRLTENTETGR